MWKLQPEPSAVWVRFVASAVGLRDSGAALAECGHMVSAGDPAAAFAKLGKVLIHAAKAAGCKHVDGGRPSRGMRRDKPYFDHKCRRMRAQFR